jgi:hypothetical protein
MRRTFKFFARREDFSSVSRYRVFATVWFFPFSRCLGGEFPAVLWLRLRRAGFIGVRRRQKALWFSFVSCFRPFAVS